MLHSYAFLNDDKWWCWCSVTPEEDDETISEAIEQEMSRIYGFDPEAAGEEEYDEMFRRAWACHDDCLEFPTFFGRYWEVDQYGYDSAEDEDEDEGEDNLPEAGE